MSNISSNAKLLTVPEASKISGTLSEYTIRKLIKEGTIKSVKSGRRNLIPREAFEALLSGAPSDSFRNDENSAVM